MIRVIGVIVGLTDHDWEVIFIDGVNGQTLREWTVKAYTLSATGPAAAPRRVELTEGTCSEKEHKKCESKDIDMEVE